MTWTVHRACDTRAGRRSGNPVDRRCRRTCCCCCCCQTHVRCLCGACAAIPSWTMVQCAAQSVKRYSIHRNVLHALLYAPASGASKPAGLLAQHQSETLFAAAQKVDLCCLCSSTQHFSSQRHKCGSKCLFMVTSVPLPLYDDSFLFEHKDDSDGDRRSLIVLPSLHQVLRRAPRRRSPTHQVCHFRPS